MKTLLIDSLRSALASAWLILRLVVPLYILSDLLLYFHLLQSVSFLFTPVTALLDLPPEAAGAIAGGVLINAYAAIALAAPLGLSAAQWTVLGIFIGVCHALIIESAIMARLGVAYGYSILLRLVGAFAAAIPVVLLLPEQVRTGVIPDQPPAGATAEGIGQVLLGSAATALVLSLKIILIITAIIVIMDLVRASRAVQSHLERVSTSFSIIVGQLLGITYGAAILIREARQGNLSQRDIFFISTFLMICHSVIEDVLLFVLFGASFWIIVTARLCAAIVLSCLLLFLVPRFISLDRFVRL